MSTEAPTFDPRYELPTFTNPDTGKEYWNEPTAQLTFPDIATAVAFINKGTEESRYHPHQVDEAYIEATHEAVTGDHGQYDAFVTRPHRETGEVTMTIRRYGRHELNVHAALSDFVVRTAQAMSETESV
jgi:hypothetical protein